MADIEIDLPSTHLAAPEVSIRGRHFVDSHERVLDLRGANVSASSKVPIKPFKIHDHRIASYVGRPFPIEEASEHWRRLRSWGLTFVRINVTWDAIEHAGPGHYDEDHLTYLRRLLDSMAQFGLIAYVAMHQDVWSRYSGGSGAPGWTLELAGFDLSDDGEKLALSGSAFLDGVRGGRLEGERGLWPTGYQKLASATMHTLFFGGKTFAPSFMVDSKGKRKVNIQEFLQESFFGAFDRLVEAVGDLDTVVGFELLNEPHPGYIGLPSIHEWNYNTDLHLGEFPSPLQSFSMGTGHPTPNVPIYIRAFPFPTRISHHITANPSSTVAWTGGSAKCIWEKEGVWRWSEQKNCAVAMQEDYFSKDRKGDKIEFYRDFYFPFVAAWEHRMAKGKGSRKMRMVGGVPNEDCPPWPVKLRPSHFVFAPHWYDLNALFKKSMGEMSVNVQGLARGMFILKALHFGRKGIFLNYKKQIQTLVSAARKELGDIPVVFGECGVPMDLNGEEALKTGNWKWQERIVDAMLSAMESCLVGFNLWTYNPTNNDHSGDEWNAENFSFFSDESRKRISTEAAATSSGLDAGGRLLDVIVRPYAVATAGTPLSAQFETSTAAFTYRFSSPFLPRAVVSIKKEPTPTTPSITEIYLPSRHYQEGKVSWLVSPGGRLKFDFPNQRLFVWFVDAPPDPSSRPRKQSVRRID
ncbi:putative cytoplasm protein, partial [Naematelia encephala]